MTIFQLLGDEIAQELSGSSLDPTAVFPMAPKVQLQTSMEAESLYDAGNVVMTDGFQSLFNNLFAAFPVAAAITSHLALNDIDALALTSRQTRANLLPFRGFITKSSLLCENDKGGTNLLGWYHACARDLVTFCRRIGCSAKFCRNCSHQRGFVHTSSRGGGPAQWEMDLRYRRLCELCQRAPLGKHNHPEYHRTAPPHKHMFCDCGRRSVGCFCDRHSVEVINFMENSLSDYYKLASLISPLCSIQPKFTTTRTKGSVLARYDGIGCARGTNCLGARVETTALGTVDNGEYEVKLSGSAGQSLVPETIQDAEDTSTTKSSTSPPYGSRIVAASIKVTKDEFINSHGAPPSISNINRYFMCPEKEGRARSLCAWCRRIVPSARDKQKYHLR